MKTDFKKIISHLQIEADKMAYLHVVNKIENENVSLLIALQEVVNFNAVASFKMAIPLIIRKECIKFILINKSELKRNLELSEVIDISSMFNRVSFAFKKIESFQDLRNKYKQITKL